MARYRTVAYKKCRGYGFTNFIGDATMTICTGGLWLIWVFIREIGD